MPYFSKITKQLALANLTRSLNILLKSGMTITDALVIARDTFNNYYYREQIDKMNEHVKRGGALSRYLDSRPDLFPPMFTGMIQVGETTGNLQENLLYLSEYYEGEVDDMLRNMTAVIEPVMLLFMGVTVGYIALSIITPIYKVTQGISQ
jgi:type II secretory pathway component PulF